QLKQTENSCEQTNLRTLSDFTGIDVNGGNDKSQLAQLSCGPNIGPTNPASSSSPESQTRASQERNIGTQKLAGVTTDSRAYVQQNYQMVYPIVKPARTETNTNGKSWGGAQTTTN